MIPFGNSPLIVTLGSRVSCAPPHHTLPAFLNLHGRKKNVFSRQGLALQKF